MTCSRERQHRRERMEATSAKSMRQPGHARNGWGKSSEKDGGDSSVMQPRSSRLYESPDCRTSGKLPRVLRSPRARGNHGQRMFRADPALSLRNRWRRSRALLGTAVVSMAVFGPGEERVADREIEKPCGCMSHRVSRIFMG